MSELAAYELKGRIATITMDDGKVNAFSIPMLRAAHTAFDQAERDRYPNAAAQRDDENAAQNDR